MWSEYGLVNCGWIKYRSCELTQKWEHYGIKRTAKAGTNSLTRWNWYLEKSGKLKLNKWRVNFKMMKWQIVPFRVIFRVTLTSLTQDFNKFIYKTQRKLTCFVRWWKLNEHRFVVLKIRCSYTVDGWICKFKLVNSLFNFHFELFFTLKNVCSPRNILVICNWWMLLKRGQHYRVVQKWMNCGRIVS